jgi:hypothetical protein
MSASNQNIELLQTTLKQLEIILKEIGENVTDNPQILAEVKTLANTAEKLVSDLQKNEATRQLNLTKKEDIDFFSEKTESKLLTEKRAKIQQKKSQFSGFLLPGILTLVVLGLVVVWYFVLPQMEVKIAQEQPKTEQPAEETDIISEIPPELTTPELPQKVETITPELELTPEQGLIAAIKNQITAINNSYAEGLVTAIEPNFMASRLIVKVSNNWYKLGESNQTSIADDIFRKAQKLDFKKLEITNIKGKLLARSPVVGNNMIVLGN